MFPNVRLMIVAILAAIAGISCGLGLFATFRVNHEPLARLAEGSPPLQLAFDNRAFGSDARVPLEARLPIIGAAKPISVPVIIDTPNAAPNLAPNLAPSAAPSLAPEQSEADSAIIGDSSAQQGPADAAAVQSNVASHAVAVPVEQPSATTEAPASGQQEVVAAAPDQPPATVAAAVPATEQMAAINADADDRQPETKSTKTGASKAAKPAAKAAHAPARTKTVRARRAVTKVAAQPTYQYAQPSYSQPSFSQPTYTQSYTWVDGAAQAVQPVKRIQIKRHRAAKNTTPAAQSNTSATTAGLSGTQ